MNTEEARLLRRCVLASIPERLYDSPVEPRFMFVPWSHVRALDPARALVVGGRGTGKTFWWETLASDIGGRYVLPHYFGQKQEGLEFEVSIGFGAKTLVPQARPLDADILTDLFHHFPERAVWKSVMLARIAPDRVAQLPTWRAIAQWVQDNPEPYARVLAETDQRLFEEKRRHVVVFDALDRTSVLWSDIVRAHRGLFALLLELWGFRAIRAKAFVRKDVLLDPEVLRFPDASKLLAAKVELTWARFDLYSLLWQYLGNSDEHADLFRSLSMNASWFQLGERWLMPDAIQWQEDVQQRIWHRLAGRWMGANERRGDTYAWLTNHLGDAFGHVSPRSFLSAVRAAAVATPDDEPLPLHPRAIQEGVRSAAEIRAWELREDFSWAEQALGALRGLTVPCTEEEILAAWDNAGLAELVDRDPEARRRRRYGSNLHGVIEDLADLGVIQPLRDGRLNVPDVYRLRFGIKRKGGVGVAPRRA